MILLLGVVTVSLKRTYDNMQPQQWTSWECCELPSSWFIVTCQMGSAPLLFRLSNPRQVKYDVWQRSVNGPDLKSHVTFFAALIVCTTATKQTMQNWIQPVKLGSADWMWIKFQLMGCFLCSISYLWPVCHFFFPACNQAPELVCAFAKCHPFHCSDQTSQSYCVQRHFGL